MEPMHGRLPSRPPLPPTSRDLADTVRIAELEQRLVKQAESLRKVMEEWDSLLDWVRGLDRKYLPRQALVEKLQSLRPF